MRKPIVISLFDHSTNMVASWEKAGFVCYCVDPRHLFEPRWFKRRVHATNGEFCALAEWINPRDRENHFRRITVFDTRTGVDVTELLSRPIGECQEIQNLDPVLKQNSN